MSAHAIRFAPSVSDGMQEFFAPQQGKSLSERATGFAMTWKVDRGYYAEPIDGISVAAKKAFGIMLQDWFPGPEAVIRDIIAACREQARFRRARRKANEIGLKYWPALLDRPRIDPMAFVYAERVMERQYGEWDPKAGSHGGWDSCGHYGLHADNVSRMWFAAGCRNSRKFRWQVSSRIIAKKGDSMAFLRNLRRGERWWNASSHTGVAISRKALCAIGRLSPELRYAATLNLPKWNSWEGKVRWIRIRDLNWAEVIRVRALRNEDTDRARAVRALALPARAAWKCVYGVEELEGCSHPIGADVPI